MSDEQDKDSKHFEPSQKKIDDAKKKGQVARSKELTTFGSLCVCLLLVIICSKFYSQEISASLISLFKFECDPLCNVSFSQIVEKSKPILLLVLGSLFVFLVAGSVFSIIIGGWVFSLNSVAPKFSKINPLAGLKRMVSFKSLVELIKSILKVIVISFVSYFILSDSVFYYMKLSPGQLESLFPYIFTELARFLGFMALAYLLVIVFDVPMQIKQFMDNMKMSLQDIKDENKTTEGNPEVKAKLKQMQRQVAASRMMSDVPMADVIVTNPTHYAVALRYKEDRDDAPVVVAVGVDAIALRIMAIGDEHSVLRLESPALARSLYRYVDIGSKVPAALFDQVAAVIVFIQNAERMSYEERIKKLSELRSLSVPEKFKYDGVM